MTPPDDLLELLPLALSRPREAVARARGLLARRPGPYVACVARHVLGIVLRDSGELGPAIRELRRARHLARAAASREREADVLATLGTALVRAGRTSAGLAALDSARRQAQGLLSARIRTRRGIALVHLGRHDEALEDLRAALAMLRAAGDTVWEARALTWRGMVHLALGRTDLANRDLLRAERAFGEAGQEFETATAVHNRGLIAFRSGDLPAALRHLDDAGRRYELLGMHWPDLALDRCGVLLAAGLPLEALREADASIRHIRDSRGEILKKAELLLAAAEAALSAADPQTARQRSDAALRLFRAQHRSWQSAHARFVGLQARSATGAASPRLLHTAAAVAAALDDLASPEASHAHLFAGRLAMALGRTTDASGHLETAARSRRRGPPVSRAGGWLAEALRAEATGDRRRMLLACGRGLDLVDEHRLTLGASELRALATRHGTELVALAQRHVLARGQPRQLLRWSERWRATALAIPVPGRSTPRDGHAADLAALRAVAAQIVENQAERRPTATLERERRRLERAVRARLLQTPSDGAGGVGRLDVAALLRELGSAQLVQLVTVDGRLHALLVGDGRVCHYPAGSLDDATREVEFARAALQRLSYGAPVQRARAAVEVLEATGRRLQQVLLGPAAGRLHAAEVVVVPPSTLQAVPWSVLPALRATAVTVAPSSTMWLRARSAPPPPTREVAVVVGPGLATAGGEVAGLADLYESVSLLGAGTATAARVLAALDGVWLAHVAAHGCFRRDSPLFSSLQLDDGPLTVYDFEHLRRAPYWLVLSSCESGLSAPVGADELLGLAATLALLGTVGIVASLVQVNDAATVPLMHALHKRIRDGARLPEALRDARAENGDDPVSLATAFSFLVLGGG